MARDFEIKLEALERELRELGETIRRACAELDKLIGDGRMASDAVDEAFRWIWHLKRRREVMLNALGRAKARDRNVD